MLQSLPTFRRQHVPLVSGKVQAPELFIVMEPLLRSDVLGDFAG